MLAEIEGPAARVVEPRSGREKPCTAGATTPCAPHRPQQATPATQSVDKGKWLSGQGRDKP